MIRGPWYVTVAAVRDYLRLTGRPDVSYGPIFERAERELIAICEQTVASGRTATPTQSGALRYRGPTPGRYQLLVVPAPREEGDRPQLVRVLPSHGR